MSISSRWFDVLGALCGLVVFSLVMAALAIALWAEDRGPVFFRQQRLGRNRVPFTILKFRSMRDGRVTRVGRLMRATGLDELPQFINILRGDMSAVGPRPLTRDDVERLGWTAPRHDFRWHSRPGLTGLAQLAGSGSSDASLELDRAYFERRTLWLDCQLVALSFAVNAFGKARMRILLAPFARRLSRTAATPVNTGCGGARFRSGSGSTSGRIPRSANMWRRRLSWWVWRSSPIRKTGRSSGPPPVPAVRRTPSRDRRSTSSGSVAAEN